MLLISINPYIHLFLSGFSHDQSRPTFTFPLAFIATEALLLFNSAMDPRDVDTLTKNFQQLTTDLDPSYLFASLIKDKIITFDEKETIESKVNRAERASALITTVTRKGPNAFSALKTALRPTYPHLHDLLSGADSVLEGEDLQ